MSEDITRLIARLRRRGVRMELWNSGTTVRVLPRSKVKPAELDLLREHRAEVLALLTAPKAARASRARERQEARPAGDPAPPAAAGKPAEAQPAEPAVYLRGYRITREDAAEAARAAGDDALAEFERGRLPQAYEWARRRLRATLHPVNVPPREVQQRVAERRAQLEKGGRTV